jgi:hypothetical protein
MRIEKQQHWRDHIATASAFPGGITAYCQSKGINPSAFYYWKKKLSPGPSKPSAPVVPGFIPIEVMSEGRSRGLPDPKWLAEFIVHLNGDAI